MNLLVTGGGGFIGSHLVESQLEKGYRVRSVDLHFTGLDSIRGLPNLEIIQADITDTHILPALVENIDVVHHLASAHLDVSLPQETYKQVNVIATENLLRASHQAGVQRFVHCSSVGVIGDVEKPPADEKTACNPTNVYEHTKLEGEQAALAYQKSTGFPVVVLRPAWVYGPRCPRTSKLVRMIKKGSFFTFGDGQNLRHPVYIADCIRGFELAAQVTGIEGQVYIIAGNTPVSTQDLVRMVADCLQVPIRTIHLPLVLGQIAGRLLQSSFGLFGVQPPFSERSLDFFTKNNAYNIDKARRDLGFNPTTDLSTGLKASIQWINHASNTSKALQVNNGRSNASDS